MFARQGYAGLNLRDLAADVDVTHTLIRYHFGNKEKLWQQVVSDMFADLEAALNPEKLNIRNRTPREQLRIFLRYYIEYCARNPEHALISIQEAQGPSERQAWIVDHIRESHQTMLPVFRSLVATGDIPDIWLVSLFYCVSTMCQFPFVMSGEVQGLYGVAMSEPAAIDAHVDAVLALLFRDQPTAQSDWPALPEWAR